MKIGSFGGQIGVSRQFLRNWNWELNLNQNSCLIDGSVILISGGSSVFMCRSNHPGDGWSCWKDTDERIDSAVYRDGKFYCISREGVMYVIDHVLSTPKVLRLSMDVSALNLRDAYRCQPVEFGGELILIVELYRLEGFQVLRVDLSEEKWVKKMDLLGDHVLFLNEYCSLPLFASEMWVARRTAYITRRAMGTVLGGFLTWMPGVGFMRKRPCMKHSNFIRGVGSFQR